MATTKQANKRPAAGATQTDTLAAMQILLTAGVPVLLWGDPRDRQDPHHRGVRSARRVAHGRGDRVDP